MFASALRLCVWSFLLLVSLCQENTVIEGGKGDAASTEPERAEALFRRLFKLERAEQLAAVKALLKISKPEKKAKLVEAILEKVVSVIRKSQSVLDAAGYIAGETSFPQNEKTRDALSNVLENTAFLGDIVLRMPDLTHGIMKNHSDWNNIFRWSLTFTNKTQLVDNKTSVLIKLVSQEMNFTQRHVNFTNPFRKLQPLPVPPLVKKKPKKKKKSIPKGPRLSSRQVGEL